MVSHLLSNFIDLKLWLNHYSSFPYFDDNPDYYVALTSTFYEFWLHDSSTYVGWLHPWVVKAIPWGEKNWIIDHDAKKIRPLLSNITEPEQIVAAQNKIISDTLAAARQDKTFKVLRGWRDELYPIYGSPSGTVSIERAGSGLFGILTFGVHLTAYVEGGNGLQIWVPRRAKDKKTYPGMLDNTVAGGMAFGEEALESIIREAIEEASFPEDMVRRGIKAAGLVSYFYIQDPREGEKSGLLQPSIRYVFDLKVDANVVPVPGDSEVEEFTLWPLDDLKKAVAEGQFRPSSTLVLLDFFIRHNILTAENESDFVEICSRIHRKLPFQVSATAASALTVPDSKKFPIPEAPTPSRSVVKPSQGRSTNKARKAAAATQHKVKAAATSKSTTTRTPRARKVIPKADAEPAASKTTTTRTLRPRKATPKPEDESAPPPKKARMG